MSLKELLDTLPDTPDAIADLFRKEGIKGDRCKSKTCPAANWVCKHMPPGHTASVYMYVYLYKDGGESVRLNSPDALYEFAQKFDVDEYPDLIQQETPHAIQ